MRSGSAPSGRRSPLRAAAEDRPGIGWLLGFTIAAEIGNIMRRAFTRLRDGPDACAWTEGAIRIAPRPAWALPEVPDWAADPFRAQAWRLAFQSLAWTWDAAESPEGAIRERAVAMAVSWSRANPWGQPSDALSLHPACMALRLESMLCLLAAAASAAVAGSTTVARARARCVCDAVPSPRGWRA